MYAQSFLLSANSDGSDMKTRHVRNALICCLLLAGLPVQAADPVPTYRTPSAPSQKADKADTPEKSERTDQPALDALNQQFLVQFNKGDFPEAWKLVKQGVNADAPLMPGGLTPLEHAARNGMMKHLVFLAEVNAKSKNSALRIAMTRFVRSASGASRLEVVDQLLQSGANPQATDAQGRSMLYWAARTGDEELYRRIIARGGVPDLYSQLMVCPASDVPSTIKIFLVEKDQACLCPPGTLPRMTQSGTRFSRWCEGETGKKLGWEVRGTTEPNLHRDLWGGWQPREISEVWHHGGLQPVQVYRCANQSCARASTPPLPARAP